MRLNDPCTRQTSRHAATSSVVLDAAMRVLVVDDHDEVRDLLARTLRRDGHETSTVATAKEARTNQEASSVDVIVLDVALIDGSGIDVCRDLRGEGNSTPVLLLAVHAVHQRMAGLAAITLATTRSLHTSRRSATNSNAWGYVLQFVMAEHCLEIQRCRCFTGAARQ